MPVCNGRLSLAPRLYFGTNRSKDVNFKFQHRRRNKQRCVRFFRFCGREKTTKKDVGELPFHPKQQNTTLFSSSLSFSLSQTDRRANLSQNKRPSRTYSSKLCFSHTVWGGAFNHNFKHSLKLFHGVAFALFCVHGPPWMTTYKRASFCIVRATTMYAPSNEITTSFSALRKEREREHNVGLTERGPERKYMV